ncbi:MAG: DUF106 domain-containing protein [Candidatus Verstraetearchaeota archaeon]|nr:DUF106 domain-containing protein [Candidatus Verstraetearchaeota archaeon]
MVLEFFSQIYLAIINGLSYALGPAKDYPLAAVTILLLSVAMAMISAVATRTLTDVDIMRRRMTEVREWQSAYSKAVRAKDQKAIDRLKKKETTIKRAQSEMTKNQFKPMLLTIIPFFIFYYLFYAVFGYNLVTVAISPITLPYIGTDFNFWVWYLISSFSVSTLIQRVFNIPSVSD